MKGPIVKLRTKYSFPINLNHHIDPISPGGDFGHYTNHSCNPNAINSSRMGIKPYIKVIARKKINKDEEITIDYASFEYETSIDGLECKCSQKICRGIIFGFKDLPLSTIKKYKKEDIIPTYLVNILKLKN